ncbi:MAG TPA: bifunctional [glutamine synthetase] adenylyltransferase/[glutamine synthetase]-adenylyl-L-tyrosine phosphorylase [Stellaceae bacterium]|jgi:glutamate-ammonia-ligase adenylyltransferase|nr:bifunctional [glutamine synthetase] adenylyltransferase/[glutamine synthetase]-adenylyl-L-tyrosine phosphorylase [Stellaceae bacterium]
MTFLSTLPPDGDGLPQPADRRRLALGFAAWDEALAGLAGDPAARRARDWSASTTGRALLAAIFGNSPFLSGLAVREWRFLDCLVEAGPDLLFAEVAGAVEDHADRAEETSALMRRLRVAKRRTALLAAVAELVGVWSLEQQTAALSRFAEAAVGAAARHLLREAAAKNSLALGDPADPESGSGLIVLGMGKLGAGELNYSSDIDLILFFDPALAKVSSRDGPQPFFSRLARDLVRVLEERTGDGYVFRTDLRLRPDPGSTPLAMSVAAALAYYESVGQNWERAALIKARPVAGDHAAGERLLRELRPYIWRKNLDFAAIQDIHSIKRQINAYRGGGHIAVAGHDIKIGRGGIREIEFFAQTQQLIWGGRIPELRVRSTCEALRRLAEAGRIDPATATALTADYRFLRRLEHRLQMVDDAQTHRLPDDRDGIAHIAVFLGYRGHDAFAADLKAHLGSVERHYAELFEQAPSLARPGNLVFTGAEDDPATLGTLARLGFTDPPAVAALVRGWHHGRMRATRSQRAREILTELVPELLRVFGATPHPDAALRRFGEFLSRLPAGVQLFSLFQANPGLLALVADIMAGAPRLADQLAQRPGLLDAVLTREFFSPLPPQPAPADELGRMLAGVSDFAEILDALRRWAGERRFQVGVQLLRGGLDGDAAGRALADIAETALAALVPAVETEFAQRHGRVPGGAFAVVGMGRLGSREMTLASDLDLILIYETSPDAAASDGEQPLAPAAYYARLSQRLIGAITAPTAEGMLYPVDMRLRPSGSSGPIASSFGSFDHYQRHAAWTWEHMALTRARPVAGEPELRRRLARTIAEVLRAPRDPSRLVADVADMRRRIAGEHPRPSPWDLKNRRGGLVDLEFIAQYLMLREAAATPHVLRRGAADALRALSAAGALPPEAGRQLGAAAALLRQVQALLTLVGETAGQGDFAELDAATLARCAGAVDFAQLDADITAAATHVRHWYERLVDEPAARATRETAEPAGDRAE